MSSSSYVSDFRRLFDVSLQKGKKFNVIASSWFTKWSEHVGFDIVEAEKGGSSSSSSASSMASSTSSSPIGPIDNSDIVETSGDLIALKSTAVERKDFFVLNSESYSILSKQFGGGPPIERVVITVGIRQDERLELWPLIANAFVVDANGDPKASSKAVKTISKQSSLKEFVEEYSKQIGIEGDIRVWVKKEGEWAVMKEDDFVQKVEYLELSNGCDLLIDSKGPNGGWIRSGGGKKNWRDFAPNDDVDALDTQGKWYESTIREVKNGKVFVHFKGWPNKWDEWIDVNSNKLAPKNSHSNGPYESDKLQTVGMQRQNSVGKPPVCGAVGLRNLGNTCFMNSTLQCLSNTPFLTEYFVEGLYTKHINRENPLGWQGKIAIEYGQLLKEIWSNSYSTVAPRGIKQAIGEFQPRFSGYQQHDSSELLSFLLDGLHEDLNRVKKKPATNQVESNGRPDPIVAKESWDRHLMRNQSVIVDLCQGQLKSRVVCPDCSRESITFDPFMFLSVPLPAAGSFIRAVVLVKAERTRTRVDEPPYNPFAYKLRIPKGGSMAELKEAMCKSVNGLKAEELLLVEVSENKIVRVFRDDALVERCSAKDFIALLEIPELSANAASPKDERGHEKYTVLQLCHFIGSKGRKMGKGTGLPGVVSLLTSNLSKTSVSELREIIKSQAKTLLKDGWKDSDKDEDLYDIILTDKSVSNAVADIPYKDVTIDLNEMSRHSAGMAFGVVWSEDAAQRITNEFKFHPSSAGVGKDSNKNSLDLSDCIDAFVKEEVLRKSECWYCSKCKKHQQATKKFDLYTVPTILIIHLKRFSYNSMYREKIETLVEFPITGLDMNRWIVSTESKEDALYDLYAVSNHFGGLGGGHYTAYAKNIIDKQWYNLDDSSVSRISDPKEAIRSSAYVLFYVRRGAKPPDYIRGK